MAKGIKCPHCHENIKHNSSKCKYCGGNIKTGDGSGFLYNVIGSGIVLGILGGLGGGWDGAITWGIYGLCFGPIVWIYNAFMKPSKGD